MAEEKKTKTKTKTKVKTKEAKVVKTKKEKKVATVETATKKIETGIMGIKTKDIKSLISIEKLKSWVLMIVAIVAPIGLIYGQFRMVEVGQSEVGIRQEQVEMLTNVKKAKVACHVASSRDIKMMISKWEQLPTEGRVAFEEKVEYEYLYKKCVRGQGLD